MKKIIFLLMLAILFLHCINKEKKQKEQDKKVLLCMIIANKLIIDRDAYGIAALNCSINNSEKK